MILMRLLQRLFSKPRSRATKERAALPEDDAGDGTGTEDVPHTMGWTVGTHWGPSDRPPKREPGPEYIAQAVEPSETDWAHEEELYREKNAPVSSD